MKKAYGEYKQGWTEKNYNSLKGNEREVLDNYLAVCRTTCSKGREEKIKMFILQARDIIEKPLTKINKQDVINYLGVINRSERATWTKNDAKKIFKKFIKWHYKDMDMLEGMEVKEAWKCVSFKNAFNYQKINPQTLVKPHELEKLIRAASSLKWKAIISFLYESAFRPCELRGLKWGDLNFNDQTGFCEISIISPKTKRQRMIIVKDSVIHLKRWREEYQFPDRKPEDYVFPSQHHRDKSLGEGVITEMFKRICQKAKIRHIYPYMLRHSRITELRKRGIDRGITSKFAGHSPEIDEIYSHLSDEDVKTSLLSKIYVTEDLPPEKKHELEERIRELEETLKGQMDFNKELQKDVNNIQDSLKEFKQASETAKGFLQDFQKIQLKQRKTA